MDLETLVATGKHVVFILGNLKTSEFELVTLEDLPLTESRTKSNAARGFVFLGATGFVNAAPCTTLDRDLTPEQVSIGDQIVSGMMENAIKSVLANDFTKESDAAAAARKAYLAGMHFPFPANIIMGPTLGALAFASVMAFNEGTDSVPGVGRGDVVPARLTPGEGVVPGGVMDGLRNVARNGGFNQKQQPVMHVHYAPQIHAVDHIGVDRMLTKHADSFKRHFDNHIRKANR